MNFKAIIDGFKKVGQIFVFPEHLDKTKKVLKSNFFTKIGERRNNAGYVLTNKQKKDKES